MRLRIWVFALIPLLLVGAASADECNPNDPTLLKPDLIAMPPSRVRLVKQSRHRFLIFTTIIGNVGDGPLILHGHTIDGPNGPVTQASQEIFRSDGTSCTRVAGDFIFHPTHHHFHFEDFSDYLLRKDDPLTGEIVARSSKVSFCLLDIMRLPGAQYRFANPQFVNDCENAEGTQGISVGLADVYDSLLPGQNIDLDADPEHPVPAGNYFLVIVTNPDGILWENNDSPESGNAGFISVAVPAPSSSLASSGGSTQHQPSGPHAPHTPVLPPRTRIPHTPHNPHGDPHMLPHRPHAPHVPGQ